MLKKVLAIVVICVTFGTNCFAFEDVYDNELSNITETLSDFSIINGYEDGTFKPDNTITRAEFAKIIIAATNLYMDVSYSNSFKDINGHWAEYYVYAAQSVGIINGVSDTAFEPESNITYEQAIKMIVAALGYSEEAMSLGGYPSGYITKANELGILDNVYCNVTDYATRGDVATMVYNALNVKYYSIWNENGEVKRMEASKTLFQIHEDLRNINAELYYDDFNSEENAVG